MDGPCKSFDEVDTIWCVQNSDVLRLDSLSLKLVNVANADVRELVEVECAETHATSPVLVLHAADNRKRRTVLVAA